VKNIDILMAGVGGQGTILASNILTEVGLELKYNVKKSEVHGMAQRGGTVESHVRWGDKVYAPLIEQGYADYLIGFEMLETARWPLYLKKGAVVIINRYRIPPPSVNLGKAKYPTEQEIESVLTAVGGRVIWVEGTKIAEELGNPAAAGVVLLGAVSKMLGGDEDVWVKVIQSLVPERFLELNKKAFMAGRALQVA
jgi:indolepyruvate ferredoxin oxidoreductase beta subunit